MESETTTMSVTTETATMMSASFDEDDEAGESSGSSGGGKRAIVLACVGAAVAAFAYSDISATIPVLAPAQTLARSVVDLVAAGVDYFVDLVLDAYDAAILGCINVFSFLQSVLLTPASSGAKTAVAGSKAAATGSFIANPSGMYSKILGMLCAKPFMSIAAVLLTLSRVLASWTFAAAEYACALLYAMPLYVATPTAVVGYLYYKKRAAKAAEMAKLKDKTKMSKAKAKAKEIIAAGESSSTSAKWAARLAGEEVTTTTTKTMAMESNAVVELNAPSMESDFDFTSEFSSSGSYSSDYTITPTPVDYDSYSSSSYSSSSSRGSSSYGSGALGASGLYDFEESYSNRDAYMGGYNVDQAEIERIYAELLPKDAGIPLPVVTTEETADGTKTTTVVEKEEVKKSEKEETKVETKQSAQVVVEKPEPVKAAAPKPVEKKAEPVEAAAPVPVEKKAEPVKAAAKPPPPPPPPPAPKVETKATTKKSGSKEAFYGFINKVSSIKTDDVAKVVTDTAKSVASKENLEKAASFAKDTVSKVQSTIDASQNASSPTLPQGTRKVSDGTNDDDLSEGTVIKKKK